MPDTEQSMILVVDDNPDNVYLLEVILHSRNYRTVSAINGREAVEAVQKNDIDLILMDVMMPEMDGFEASGRIRNMKASEHIPIVLLTAKKRDTEDIVRGLDEGALEYVTKPFDEAELMARVKSMLRIKHLHDSNRELLHKLLEQQSLMDAELKMASHVQKAMLPEADKFTQNRPCSIDTYYQATTAIGGDFYDFIEYGENKTAFLIADVSGHGPAAALIVAMLKTLLANESQSHPSPSQLMQKLNVKLCAMIPDDQFITMFFCVVDFNTNLLTFTRAGHPPPYLFGEKREEVMELDTIGMVVGMFEDTEFGEDTVKLDKGDKLFFFSDGLFETSNGNGDLYGLARMKSFVHSNRADSGKKIIKNLIEEIEGFWDGKSDRDDLAAVIVEFN